MINTTSSGTQKPSHKVDPFASSSCVLAFPYVIFTYITKPQESVIYFFQPKGLTRRMDLLFYSDVYQFCCSSFTTAVPNFFLYTLSLCFFLLSMVSAEKPITIQVMFPYKKRLVIIFSVKGLIVNNLRLILPVHH
jgi:hypothetical protein